MKIKYLVPLASGVVLGAVLFFYFANQQFQKEIDLNRTELKIANDISNNTIILVNLTYEYLTNLSERARDQWWIKYDENNRLLAPVLFRQGEETEILNDLLTRQRTLSEFFLKLLRSYELGEAGEFEKQQYISETMFASEESMVMVAKLHKVVGERLDQYQYTYNFYINIIFGVLTLLVITTTIIVVRKVVGPLNELHRATEIIAGGNLSHRIKIQSNDEIGQLARSFDIMALKLKESYTGLEKKVKTKTKDLAEAKTRAEAILASIGDAVMACDVDGKILVFNSVAEKMTGFSFKEVVGRHFKYSLNFISEKDEKPIIDFITKTIKTGISATMTNHTLLITKKGQKIPVADSAAPIINDKGKTIGCVVVFSDVTKEREIDKTKTEFVSLASHQLRTPLASINWISEMFLNKDFGKITGKQEESIAMIHKSSQRMVGLISALLNVSKLELGTFTINPTPVKLSSVVDEIVQELNLQIKGKKLVVIKDYKQEGPPINADLILIKIICQNLLTNAVNYSFSKTNIKVKIIKDEQRYLLTVENKGIGIPKEDEKKIFFKLFRASNAQSIDTDGTGLGLYMVKSILDAVGGKIWFNSIEGEDTIFSVELPLGGMKAKTGTKNLELV